MTRLLVIVLAMWLDGGKAQAALAPVNLRCAQRVNPLGIGDNTPRLSWQLQSGGQGTGYRGETQSAYEIKIGSTAGGRGFCRKREKITRPNLGSFFCDRTI